MLSRIDGTEEEFRAFVAIQQEATRDNDYRWQQEQQIALFGEERMRQYQRSFDNDYTTLVGIARFRN